MARQGNRQSSETSLDQALKTVRHGFATIVVFSLFINLLMLVAPMYMLQLYDRVLPGRNENTLIMLTIIVAAFILVYGLLETIRSRLLTRIGSAIDIDVSSPVLSAVFQRSISKPSGVQTQALRDVAKLREFIAGPGVTALCDAPWAPLFMGLIFLFHPLLGVVALIGSVLIFSLALLNELLTRKRLAEGGQAESEANTFVSSGLRNAEAVSAMGMLPAIVERWEAKHQEAVAKQGQAGQRSGAITATSKGVRLLLQVAMLGTGASLVIAGEITPGTMIAGSIIMARALAPIESAVSQWRSFVQAREAYKKLQELLTQTRNADPAIRLPEPEGRVSIENAVITPPESTKPTIKRVSYEVQPGTVVGILGPSGAGKSSLIRALAGVWPTMAGSIRLDGAEITHWPNNQKAQHIGYLPQNIELFDGTVAENIARFTDADSESIVEAARTAGAHEMILELPKGYETPIGPSGNALSGGQRQRIALARAFFGDVRLVLLDEPGASLDETGRAALKNAIHRCRERGCTVFVIAHQVDQLDIADELMMIQNGELKSAGPRKEVLAALRQKQTRSRDASKRSNGQAGSPETSRKTRSEPENAGSNGKMTIGHHSREDATLIRLKSKTPTSDQYTPRQQPNTDSDGYSHA